MDPDKWNPSKQGSFACEHHQIKIFFLVHYLLVSVCQLTSLGVLPSHLGFLILWRCPTRREPWGFVSPQYWYPLAPAAGLMVNEHPSLYADDFCTCWQVYLIFVQMRSFCGPSNRATVVPPMNLMVLILDKQVSCWTWDGTFYWSPQCGRCCRGFHSNSLPSHEIKGLEAHKSFNLVRFEITLKKNQAAKLKKQNLKQKKLLALCVFVAKHLIYRNSNISRRNLHAKPLVTQLWRHHCVLLCVAEHAYSHSWVHTQPLFMKFFFLCWKSYKLLPPTLWHMLNR